MKPTMCYSGIWIDLKKFKTSLKEQVGKVFSIAKDNKALEGCTISKEVHGGENYIAYFSMAEDTDISAELFPYYKLLIVAEGEIEVYGFSAIEKYAM